MTVHSRQPVFLTRSLEDKAVDDEAKNPTDHENWSGREYTAFGGLFNVVV